ncbi:probable receptor-like serine/threonine-protein kinase [Tanacetum coccineum]
MLYNQDAVTVVGYPIGGTRNLSEFNADRDTISITRAEDGTLDQHQPSLSSRSFSGRGRLLSGETIFLGAHALAHEYFMYGKVNDKIDVYAFRVVLLELLLGRKPISNEYPKGEESLHHQASVLEVGLPDLLEDGIEMLIYVGKYDLVCNLLVDGKLAGDCKYYVLSLSVVRLRTILKMFDVLKRRANVLGHQNVALRYEKYRRIKIRIVWDSS